MYISTYTNGNIDANKLNLTHGVAYNTVHTSDAGELVDPKWGQFQK